MLRRHFPPGHPVLHAELINLPTVELLPAALARARSVVLARQMIQGGSLIRAKSDGRYLALLQGTLSGPTVRWLVPPAMRQKAGLDRETLAGLPGRERTDAGLLPFDSTCQLLADIGVPHDYGSRSGLPEVPEPTRLAYCGRDRYRRPLWLIAPVAAAWARMCRAAQREGVVLLAISGYRSHLYQAGIFRRKQARGQSIEQILAVNAAPGYSEHHSGRALDIGCAGEPPAEERFEASAAFAWLSINAARFGFVMSYPRDNPHGIFYEPWHWCWRGDRRQHGVDGG